MPNSYRRETCAWCGQELKSIKENCPNCGANQFFEESCCDGLCEMPKIPNYKENIPCE